MGFQKTGKAPIIGEVDPKSDKKEEKKTEDKKEEKKD
jgi:hypothetical protein